MFDKKYKIIGTNPIFISASSLQSSKSSFLNSSSRETLSSRRPRFNESVVTNVLQRTSALSSPFYDGNTTFGGANTAGFYSHNRNFFNNSLNQVYFMLTII